VARPLTVRCFGALVLGQVCVGGSSDIQAAQKAGQGGEAEKAKPLLMGSSEGGCIAKKPLKKSGGKSGVNARASLPDRQGKRPRHAGLG
jgi:hypothetical protein